MSDTVRCQAFRHQFDGHVFLERSRATGRTVWVARLECPRCGTRRVDVMVPETCELISRSYEHSDEYRDALDTRDRDDAKRIVFTSMLTR